MANLIVWRGARFLNSAVKNRKTGVIVELLNFLVQEMGIEMENSFGRKIYIKRRSGLLRRKDFENLGERGSLVERRVVNIKGILYNS